MQLIYLLLERIVTCKAGFEAIVGLRFVLD
jgi:hypothetical protein